MGPSHNDAGTSAGVAQVAVRGMFWTGLAAVISKLASFAAQVALGWLLAEDDFAVYALAISLATIVGAFQHAGLHRVLIHHVTDFSDIARASLRIAFLCNVAIALVLFFGAIAAAHYYRQPQLIQVVGPLAIAIPISTFGMVYSAALITRYRFRDQTRIMVASTMIRYLSMVTFAFLGLGALSFVFPLPLIALYEWIGFRRAAGALPQSQRSSREVFRNVLRESRWIMLSTPAISVSQFGDYLVLGRMGKALLAPYFFGYQLANSFVQPLSAALLNVLVPTFSSIRTESERRAVAFQKSVRVMMTVFSPVCICAAFLARDVIDVIWQGKWNSAAYVVQIMLLCLPFLTLTPLAVAILQAIGRWATFGALMWLHALTTVVAAVIGARSGDIVGMVLAICFQHVMNGVLQVVIAGYYCGITAQSVIRNAVIPYAVAAGCGLIALALSWAVGIEGMAGAIGGGLAAAILMGLGFFTVLRIQAKEIAELVLPQFNRVLKRAPVS